MVAQNRISAVVSSTDLERSRELYEQKVGLTLSPETIPNHLLFEAGGGTTLLVYGRASPNLADHTQVRLWCADVAADVSELVGCGVEFDLVEFGDFKMVDHVLTTPVGSSSVVQRPGWQHNPTRPACLASPRAADNREPRSLAGGRSRAPRIETRTPFRRVLSPIVRRTRSARMAGLRRRSRSMTERPAADFANTPEQRVGEPVKGPGSPRPRRPQREARPNSRPNSRRRASASGAAQRGVTERASDVRCAGLRGGSAVLRLRPRCEAGFSTSAPPVFGCA